MSERKSWDIQPRKKVIPQPAPRPSAPAPSSRPAPRTAPNRPEARRPTRRSDIRQKPPVPKKVRAAREPMRLGLGKKKRPAPRIDHDEPVRATPAMRPRHVPQGKDREPLKNSRRRARKRMQVILSVLFVLIVIGLYVCIWLPVFRIQYVQAAGPDATNIQQDTQNALKGTFEYVIPRNSIFFFPESEIRAQLLSEYPDVSAISISRTSFDSISLGSIPRETAFVWCGESYSPSGDPTSTGADSTALTSTDTTDASSTSSDVSTSASPTQPLVPSCYDADDSGLIFAADPTPNADVLKVYGPLVSSTTMPIGMHVSRAASIPNALEFVKDIRSLGVPVTALVLRDDEADIYAQSGTRITYVLGQEQAAIALAASTFPSLNINDGSLEYVDLRFAGKVYFKKYGADTSDSSGDSTSTSE